MQFSKLIERIVGASTVVATIAGCNGSAVGNVSPNAGLEAASASNVRSAAIRAKIKEFALPHSGSGPYSIALGAHGNLWFTESAGNRIGRITPLGPDGNLWFTEFYGNAIGRITPGGKITEFPVRKQSAPNGITAGLKHIWFTESGEKPYGIKIGMITTSGKIDHLYSIPTAYNSNPEGIVFGWDSRLWVAEANAGNAIVRSTTSGKMQIFAHGLSAQAYPQQIAAGPDGNLWFTESGKPAQIGRITTGGTVTEFKSGITQCNCNYNLFGIASGPDGNLWFTETSTNKIAQITTGGQVTEFSGLSPNSAPTGITAGWGGTLWFTENAGNAIGRLKI
jgi:streptogramin lyase